LLHTGNIGREPKGEERRRTARTKIRTKLGGRGYFKKRKGGWTKKTSIGI